MGLKSKLVPTMLAVSMVGNVMAVSDKVTSEAIAGPLTLTVKHTVRKCLTVGQSTAVLNVLKSAVCDEMEEHFGMSNGTCGADYLPSLWVYRDIETCPTSETRLQAVGEFPGDFAVQLPEIETSEAKDKTK